MFDHTFLIFMLSLSKGQAWDPSGPFPSCMRADITWDQSNLFDVVGNSTTAEDCQSICADRDACIGFTWLSTNSSIFPHSCGLFSSTGDDIPCEHCVSGAVECLCTVQGECVSQDHNMIQAYPQIPTVDQCRLLCEDNSNCSEYTYFEESHVMSHLCLLFSSCDTLDKLCEDCVTGSPDCQICSFENTIDGQCEVCDAEWNLFGEYCYKLMDNAGQHYNDINACTEECKQAGGHLASIHSPEENEFIYSIMPPAKSGILEQGTWIGATESSGHNFNWTDGTAWDYTNWRSGQPDGEGGHCVVLGYTQSAPNQWDDISCPIGGLNCICKL